MSYYGRRRGPLARTDWRQLQRLSDPRQWQALLPEPEGETTVLKPGKTFKVLAKNKLDGQHMASAAVDDNALILRTDKALYRIGK